MPVKVPEGNLLRDCSTIKQVYSLKGLLSLQTGPGIDCGLAGCKSKHGMRTPQVRADRRCPGNGCHGSMQSPFTAFRSVRRPSRKASDRRMAAHAAVLDKAQAKAEAVVIPGGKGKAGIMQKGELIKVTNTLGFQVVDFWAFSTAEWGAEIMSMHHTRNALCRTTPKVGDTLYTASMVPIMTFLEDTGPGVHDTTAAACSYGLYKLQIGEEAANKHDSCTNNLYNALGEIGYSLAKDPRHGYYTPAPFNLWMNVTDEPDASGYNWVEPPKEQKPGDYVVFRAEQDVVVAFSACPWDIGDMNGEGGKPQDASFQIFSG